MMQIVGTFDSPSAALAAVMDRWPVLRWDPLVSPGADAGDKRVNAVRLASGDTDANVFRAWIESGQVFLAIASDGTAAIWWPDSTPHKRLGRPPTVTDGQQITIKLSAATITALKQHATATGETLSQIVDQAVRERLALP